MKKLLLLLISVLAMSAQAGDKVGNSCKTIVCFSDPAVLKEILAPELKGSPSYGLIRDQDISKIISVETIDLHEAKLEDLRFPGRGQIFEIKTDETEWQWIERVKARFAPAFPYIHKLIPPSQEVFGQILIADRSVAPVDDARSAWVFEPSSCTTVTTALQRKIGDLGRIQLDGRLYRHPKMSSLSRAVMMLHEVMYFVQLNRFHLPPPPEPENSAPTRALIGFLIQKDLSAIPTVGALVDEIVKLGFKIPWGEIHPALGIDFQAKGIAVIEKILPKLKSGKPNKNRVAEELRKIFSEDFPDALFQNNGYSSELNSQIKNLIQRLYEEFWISVVFKGDALVLEELNSFQRTRMPNLLVRDTANTYSAIQSRVYEMIREQRFSEARP